ncbi:hypothetical protein GCM10010247_43850 [Streptomyces calvus]|nr:hypothetical protein GCM10010247_43850 [Streptomyces calvus]
MIVLGRRRGLVRGAPLGLEVRQEAVVKEAAHRSPSLGRPTDNPGPPRNIAGIPGPPGHPAQPCTVQQQPFTLRHPGPKVTKMYRAYHPPTFTGTTRVGYGADGPLDPHRRTPPGRAASAESVTAHPAAGAGDPSNPWGESAHSLAERP